MRQTGGPTDEGQTGRPMGEGQIDRRTVERHLDEALQHLATAGVVIRHLERGDMLDLQDRRHLAAEIHRIRRLLHEVGDPLEPRLLVLDLPDLQRDGP